MTSYTIQQFKDILFDGIGTNIKLSEETKETIKYLSSILSMSDDDNILHKNNKQYNNDDGLYKKNYKEKELKEDWESVRNFKTTKIEKKEGIEKKINEIRIALNKISENNKIEQTLKIIELIEIVFESNNDTSENIEKIMNFVFDTASSNAFFSELYAELYKNIINKYTQFKSKIDNILINYKESFNEIKPVDSNKDYDAYCDFIKKNDKRKAMTKFMCNLVKYEILENNQLYLVIQHILDKICEDSILEDNSSIIEELCDNLFILITNMYNFYKTDSTFNDEVIKKLKEISQYRKINSNLYKSMTSRASFKIMDIIEFTTKNK